MVIWLVALGASAQGSRAIAAEFQGWQGMRVIHQEGNPDRLVVGDLEGNGRRQVIVVNTRQSRLDIYRWLPAAERPTPTKSDPTRPNELPLAPEWDHQEVGLDELPADVVLHDLDGDRKPELLVLTGPQLKVLAFKQQPAASDTKKPDSKKAVWKKTTQWDLLPSTPTGKGRLLLVRHPAKGKPELLITCEAGIQVLPLESGSRSAWLSPREKVSRTDWALADLDGDGDSDLIESTAQARQAVRWYESVDGRLLPAQVLHEHSVQGFGTLTIPQKPAEVLLLGGAQEGHLRRYALAQGDESDLGRRDSLPMPGGTKAAWCGVRLDQKHAIVAVDPAQPRLRVHELGQRGWLAEQSYPTLGNIRAIAAPAARSGTLLIWVKDAGQLYISRWENNRLTYPALFSQAIAEEHASGSAKVENTSKPDAAKQIESAKPTESLKQAEPDKSKDTAKKESDKSKDDSTKAADQPRLLALDTVGRTTWWAQRTASNVDLFVWRADKAAPERTRFAGLGAKIERVVWLGGRRLLVQDAYATTAKLAVFDGEKLSVTEPTQLGKVDLAEFSLYTPIDAENAAPRLGRLVDGVLQWLGDDLHPVDQVMLPDGQKMATLLLVKNDAAWALEQGGAFVHRLQADDGGVLRVIRSVRPPVGSQLRYDPVLGLMLVDAERVVRLSPGRPFELKLLESIDGRVGRPSGVKEATIHRFFTADIDGDGTDEALLCDDRRHQLTVLRRGETQMQPLISWQVFEDQTYPYGGGQQDSLVTEPRAVAACDVDGDQQQDLILLSQDRLLIYLSREVP
jgi:hypothetical protein